MILSGRTPEEKRAWSERLAVNYDAIEKEFQKLYALSNNQEGAKVISTIDTEATDPMRVLMFKHTFKFPADIKGKKPEEVIKQSVARLKAFLHTGDAKVDASIIFFFSCKN